MELPWQLCLFKLTAAGTHGAADIPPDRPGVGLGPLPSGRKPPRVAHSPIRSDVPQPLDIRGHLPPHISFNFVSLYMFAYLILLLGRKLGSLKHRVNMRLLADLPGAGRADAVERCERVRKAFLVRKRNAGDSHIVDIYMWVSALALLVAGVLADDINPPFAANHLAFHAPLLNRGFYFHILHPPHNPALAAVWI